MNTVIMDAHNLAWKLALVADGSASDRLLDSYEQERRPVAGNVLGLSDAIVRWETMSHPVKRALRDAFIPTITRLPAVQRAATQRLSQISVAYPSSPLNQPDRGRHGPKPGERVRDIDAQRLRKKLACTRCLAAVGTCCWSRHPTSGGDSSLPASARTTISLMSPSAGWARTDPMTADTPPSAWCGRTGSSRLAESAMRWTK